MFQRTILYLQLLYDKIDIIRFIDRIFNGRELNSIADLQMGLIFYASIQVLANRQLTNSFIHCDVFINIASGLVRFAAGPHF